MKTEKKVSPSKESKESKGSKGSEVIGTNKPNPEASASAPSKETNSDPFGGVTTSDYPTGHADLGTLTDHSKALSMETSMLRELTKGLLATLISTQKK
jgi:hypothetical protein